MFVGGIYKKNITLRLEAMNIKLVCDMPYVGSRLRDCFSYEVSDAVFTGVLGKFPPNNSPWTTLPQGQFPPGQLLPGQFPPKKNPTRTLPPGQFPPDRFNTDGHFKFFISYSHPLIHY